MNYGELYNQEYYRYHVGELPYDDPAWEDVFRRIAEHIVNDFHPQTFLDVGCAMGHLVSALRDMGVDAYGIDASEYAISKVRPEYRDYFRVWAAPEPFPSDIPQEYDMLSSIEVVEHLHEEDGDDFIAILCSHSKRVLFSSSPDDITEATHFNVQQPEYWLKRFAKHGYFRDLNYSVNYIAPQAMCLSYGAMEVPHVVEAYEHHIRLLEHRHNQQSLSNQELEEQKITNLNQEILEKSKKIAELEYAGQQMEKSLEEYRQRCSEMEEAVKQTREQLCKEQARNTLQEQMIVELDNKGKKALEEKQGEVYALMSEIHRRDFQLQQMNERNRRSIKVKCDNFKNRLFPRGTRRFVVAKIIFHSPRYLLRGYPFKAIAYLLKHGYSDTKKRIREIVYGIPFQTELLADTAVAITGGVRLPAAIPSHTCSVDIIICVHNAYEDVKKCIESVFEYTAEPYSIIIVDDGSAEQTRDYLKSIEESCPNVRRIRNEKGNGYTIAANMGLRASTADYCVLLNSDTIVTSGWLDKMIACAQSDPAIGIVGPLSNTASWQSIPKVFDEDGDWCHNVLPDGIDVQTFGRMVEKYSGQLYFNVPLLNGFCLMIARKTIEKVGYLDEENFGRGFGEEDDFNLRAYSAGIKLAVADNTYIFHSQSKSYTDTKRLELCKTSGAKVRAKHGDALLDFAVNQVHKSYIFLGIRARVVAMLEREQIRSRIRQQWEGKRILFILPIAEAGGGGNVIIQEAQMMIEMGLDVYLYNEARLKHYFEQAYPQLSVPVIYGEGLGGFRAYASDFDVICSSLYATVRYCDFSAMKTPPIVAYYVQDYEPYFFTEGSAKYLEAEKSYTAIPGMVRVTKTTWNANEVLKHHRVPCTVIGPSINIDLFRPRKHLGNQVVHICAMIRPESPRRAPGLTMKILKRVALKYGDRVCISIFGSDPTRSPADAAFFRSVETDFAFTQHGKLSPLQMADLLSESDVFADFSSFQAMGLTAMEAMASGCAVIVPQSGGAGDFAKNEENCLVVDTHNEDACMNALCRLIDDSALRERLCTNGIQDMCQYYPEKSAYNFLNAVFEKKGE